ncbi:VanW family protein [Luteimicrobium subarcticum]|uniref:Vancomycin resistance protein YoaR n=1 Tax=Luteimicrobium subarcticum TaxID=620910 RepID=A0A2M8WUP5_9MICO|nr:VanW family protein [Luteimicrobium subarcticum]PJI94634.1 vancomycin resistance protein YoaR [Luteimicrobium subarcticum]
MEQQHVVAPDGRPEADDTDLLQGVGSEPAPSRTWRVLAVLGGSALLLVGLYAAAQWYVADKVPRGTTVAGVALGGLDVHAAEQKLAADLADRTTQPVQVVAGASKARIDPVKAGLTVDVDATVEPLATFDLSPQRLWHAAFGGTAVDPVVRVDDAALAPRLASVAKKAAVAPRDGAVTFVGGSATSTSARPGAALDTAGAKAALVSSWLRTDGPVVLPVTAVAPKVDDDAVQDALVVAGTLTSAPVELTVGRKHVTLPSDALARVARFSRDGSSLKLSLDADGLRTAVVSRAPKGTFTAPRDATLVFVKGEPRVRDGRNGSTVHADTVLAAVVPVATRRGDRHATVRLSVKEPALTAERLRALRVTERVSSFSTALTSDTVRTANIRTGAAKVSGTVVQPGETFSMLDALAPITLAGGYHAAHVISDGQLVDGVGGGLSQMATTTYNAAFFAGLDIVTHKPHSFYISRYPVGREATLAMPSVDMKFTNDTPYGVAVQAWISGNRLHVALWSTPYYTVATTTSARSDVVPRHTIRNASPSCVADPGGQPGFTVSVRRVVSRLDGTQVKDETNRWTYNPENTVICTKGD